MKLDVEAQKDLVLKSLDDDKGEDILLITLPSSAAIADYMVVASGRSSRQVAALADHLLRKLANAGVKEVRIEGQQKADWVLIDTGDIIVHIFRPEVREFYDLERIWSADPKGSSDHPVMHFSG